MKEKYVIKKTFEDKHVAGLYYYAGEVKEFDEERAQEILSSGPYIEKSYNETVEKTKDEVVITDDSNETEKKKKLRKKGAKN